MSLSDTMQIRFERFNEKLSDMQSQISNLENRNTNNEAGGTSIFSFPPSNTFRGQGESAILSTGSRENSNIKVRPQLYDGLSDIDEYLTQFNIVAQINQWGSNIKALHLASCLTGNARSLLSELDLEHQQNFSFLVSALQCRFGTVNRAEVYRAQLKNRVRQKGESIPELAQNVRKLTRQAYPGANSNLIDTLALDHFIDSLLDSETRLRLRECSPKTIQEAETLAVKLEAQRMADKQRSKNVGSLSEASEKSEIGNDMKKIAETVNGLVESVEKLQNRNQTEKSHPRDKREYINVNERQNRSHRPYSNFNNRNRPRGNNWTRNWSQNGHNNQNFSGPPDRQNFNRRPMEQQNSSFRSQQQGNENRSSLGVSARPWRR